MSAETILYLSVEGASGHLVISGPLVLFRELIGSFAPVDQVTNQSKANAHSPSGQPAILSKARAAGVVQ